MFIDISVGPFPDDDLMVSAKLAWKIADFFETNKIDFNLTINEGETTHIRMWMDDPDTTCAEGFGPEGDRVVDVLNNPDRT